MKFENQFSKSDSAFTTIISPSDVDDSQRGVLIFLMFFYIILGIGRCLRGKFTFIKSPFNICF